MFDDVEIENLEEGYKETPMVLQLHKLLDSEGNKVELEQTVITDGGVYVDVTFEQARQILFVANAISVKHRKTFFDDIQTTSGMRETLECLDHLVDQAKKAVRCESLYERFL